MILTNTSQYPDDEVRRLVEFAVRNLEHNGLAVNVKNSASAYRGRAYKQVPHVSPLRGKAKDLIVVAIGKPASFPCNNMTTTYRWKRVDPSRAYDPSRMRGVMKRVNGVEERYFEELIESTHPYGGRLSPFIEFRCWREALVGITAHEARHIWQYRFNKPRSEVDCETIAAKRLREFRETATPLLAVASRP